MCITIILLLNIILYDCRTLWEQQINNQRAIIEKLDKNNDVLVDIRDILINQEIEIIYK